MITAEVKQINLKHLLPSPSNPRKTFDNESIEELAASIDEHGLIHPLLIRRIDDPERIFPPKLWKKYRDQFVWEKETYYEVVSGERRLRALNYLLEWVLEEDDMEVPCTIKEISDGEVLAIQIAENLQREDVPPLEEAAAFLLIATGGTMPRPIEELAELIGKSKSYIRRRMSLNNLQPKWKKVLKDEGMGVTHALEISRLPESVQTLVYKSTVRRIDKSGKSIMGITLSLPQLRAHIEESYNIELARAKFDTRSEELVPAAGSCWTCEKNTAVATTLFPEYGDAVCTDRECFKSKVEAARRLVKQAYEAEMAELEMPFTYVSFGYWDDKEHREEIQKSLGSGIPAEAPIHTVNKFQPCEEGDPGALKALVVAAPQWSDHREEVGTVIYVQLHSDDNSYGPDERLTPEERLEYRQDAVERKREEALLKEYEKFFATKVRGKASMSTGELRIWAANHIEEAIGDVDDKYRDKLTYVPPSWLEEAEAEWEELQEGEEEHGFDGLEDYTIKRIDDFRELSLEEMYDKCNWDERDQFCVHLAALLSKGDCMDILRNYLRDWGFKDTFKACPDIVSEWIGLDVEATMERLAEEIPDATLEEEE